MLPLLSSSPLPKVCIVYHCWKENSSNYEFKFYIVGRDSSPGHIEPAIRFKGSKADSPTVSFCALNSTLYMFEGDKRPRLRRLAGTYAAKFDTTPQILAGSDYELTRNNLLPINPMNQPKICPIALPTPDNKSILVFSSQFSRIDPDLGNFYDDSFELYDVGEGSWKTLPRLPSSPPPLGQYSHHHVIVAYGFCDSRFVIQMDSGPAFALNFQKLEWELDFFLEPNVLREGYGCLLGLDQFYFTPKGAFDIRDGLGHFYFDPYLLSRFPIRLAPLPPRIALLGDAYDDGSYDISVVQGEMPSSHSNNTLVILRICRIDLVQLKRDFEKYQRDLEKYMGKVQESLPDMPLFDAPASKTPQQFRRAFEEYKRDMERYLEQYTLTFEGHGPPDMPLVKTTLSKTVELRIDFDNVNYSYGTMHLFSI